MPFDKEPFETTPLAARETEDQLLADLIAGDALFTAARFCRHQVVRFGGAYNCAVGAVNLALGYVVEGDSVKPDPTWPKPEVGARETRRHLVTHALNTSARHLYGTGWIVDINDECGFETTKACFTDAIAWRRNELAFVDKVEESEKGETDDARTEKCPA